MAGPYLPVTVVNHAAIDIAASADRLWRLIREDFGEAQRWRSLGYSIEPIDDPAAVLGGYRMWMQHDGKVVDNRICHLTEIDETARRLSLFIDYLSEPGGAQVYVTYQAHDITGATRFTLDCHTRVGIQPPDDGQSIAATVDAIKTKSDTHLAGYLAQVKAGLEGAQ
jgi:hypothetical protein